MRISLAEWLYLALLSGFLLLFFVTSELSKVGKKYAYPFQKELATQRYIEINVTGAVISPGVYTFPPGTSVKEVLERAGLSSTADKKNINFARKIFTAAKLEVPEKEMVKSKLRSNKEKM